MPKGVYKRKPHIQETKDKISKTMTGRKQSQEHIDKRAESRKGYIVTQETKDKLSKSHTGYKQSQEHIDNAAEARKGYKHTQETKDRIRKSLKGRKHKLHTQATKDKMSKTQTELWKDPVYRDSQIKAIMEGSDKSPNECEKLLFSIVNNLFPNQYLLNTKGEHIRLKSKAPDIVNLQEKKCIEHYGDRWHGNTEYWKVTGTTLVDGLSLKEIHTRDKKRIKLLESLGWKVLIVWEHELKDISKLGDKLIKFHEGDIKK